MSATMRAAKRRRNTSISQTRRLLRIAHSNSSTKSMAVRVKSGTDNPVAATVFTSIWTDMGVARERRLIPMP